LNKKLKTITVYFGDLVDVESLSGLGHEATDDSVDFVGAKNCPDVLPEMRTAES
jgi:hypothetical protein